MGLLVGDHTGCKQTNMRRAPKTTQQLQTLGGGAIKILQVYLIYSV